MSTLIPSIFCSTNCVRKSSQNWVSHTSVFWAQNKGSFGQIFGTPVTRVFGTPKKQFCRFYWDENTAFYYFLASDRRASACRERKSPLGGLII